MAIGAGMSDTVEMWRAGRISAAVALAQMVIDGADAEQIARLLPAGSEIASLFAEHRNRVPTLAAMLRESGAHLANGSVAAIRDAFERAVAVAPEASVAAYSLGDASLLAEATGEIVEFLQSAGALGRDVDVLDVGCGIGRVSCALAPLVRSVLGTDISTGMIARAAARCAGLGNVRFLVVDGVSEWPLEDDSVNLVLFVDSMPYLMDAKVAEPQVLEAARVLRPEGKLVMFNLSYQGDETDDEAAARWAARNGWRVTVSEPFRLWDARVFIFESRGSGGARPQLGPGAEPLEINGSQQ